jgi:hypothetical protein
MHLQDEFAEPLILCDQVSDVGSGGGKAFSGVINGNPAALIRNALRFERQKESRSLFSV